MLNSSLRAAVDPLLRARVSYRAIISLILTLTLLLPIGAPIPAWAYDHLPEQINEQHVGELQSQTYSAAFSYLESAFVDDLSGLFENLNAGGGSMSSLMTSEPSLSSPKRIQTPADSTTVAANSKITKESPGAIKTENEPAISPEVDSRNNVLTTPLRPASLLLADDDSQVIRDSTYSSENNVGNPPGKFEAEGPIVASATRIEDRAGIANFSFGVPLAALPGRGISVSVGMTYNSRVWNKSEANGVSTFSYNVDKNWIAPGFTIGYGSLSSHFEGRTIRMNNGDLKTYNEVVPDGYTDPDGTRHQLECKIRTRIPGTETAADAGVENYYCPEYSTKDGTFSQVIAGAFSSITAYHSPDKTNYAFTTFTVVNADGTRISYSAPGSQFGSADYSRDHYPMTIQDSNGNQISIGYLNGTDRIQVIQDTVGRQIKFYYDNSSDPKLASITVPGFNGGDERAVARFYYQDDVPLPNDGFSGTVVAPPTYRALKYVYFPATGSGYRYDYHSLGLISKITKLMGMTVSPTAFNSIGGVTSNDATTTAATTEYNYLIPESPNKLTDVPRYNHRTDSWRTSSSTFSSSTTDFADLTDHSNSSSDVVTVVTVPQGSFSVEYRTVADAGGFTKETSVTQVGAGTLPKLMSKTVYSWDWRAYGSVGGTFWYIKRVEVTNDALQTRATELDVDDYNNTKLIRECAIAASNSTCTELRRTETTFINGTGWINNNILRLPGTIETKANGATVSKTVYNYDENSQLPDTPNVVQHDPAYNPNQGTHQEWHWECNGEPSPPRCSDGTPADHVPVDVPNSDPRYNYRGNLTTITSYPDATGQNASVNTMSYDMTGNVIQASLSCCQMKTIEYSDANQFAYPTKVTKGTAPTQLVTFATYDKNTGLVVNTTDENNQSTDYHYDPVSLRQSQVIRPNGASTTLEYNDSQFPYSVITTSSLDASRSVSSWSYFNGAGLGFRSRSLTASGYLSNDVEYDSLGRPIKTYNPYSVAQLTDNRPDGIKFTEATTIDALGRVVETTLQDGSKVHSYPDESTTTYTAPNGQTITGTVSRVQDQAGKQRWQVVDSLGRIVRVDEPDSSGAPSQPTYYEYDGNDNLTKVTQSIPGVVTQERVFYYDWLSRLKRERQVEATPTLDDSGVKGDPSPTKWTGVYNYNTDGLLTEAFDARGVKTTLGYDGLNRLKTVSYSGESGYQTPPVTYTYGEARSDGSGQAYSNIGRLTTVKTDAYSNTGTQQATPATYQYYNYDKAGQIVDHTQTLGTDTYILKYGYNLAGQLTSETYPSGRVVSTTIDNYGTPQTVYDTQRTYVNGISFNFNSTGMTSQMTLGNGTVENNILNERFQLTSQSLTRNSDVLQKYEYTYASINLDNGSPVANSNNGQLGKIESYIGANKQWSQRFGYDELGRLKEAREYKQGDSSHLTYRQVFDFDRFGNLYRKSANNPMTGQENPLTFTAIEETTTQQPGDIDKATNRFKTGVTYNDAGQVISDTKFNDMGFAYDANGRQIKATRANTPDALTVYDALGNRVATKVNDAWRYMIYDAFGQLVVEYGASSTEGTGGVKFVQQDSQGSVRTITNSNGFVVGRTDHEAFGEEIGIGTGTRSIEQGYSADRVTRQGYALTEQDEASGQQHTWARKLNSAAGKWDSPDPDIGSMSLDDPQSFNRYSYVGNQPKNFADPSGLEPCSAEYSFSQCGGSFGFWGISDRGFGGNVAADDHFYEGIPTQSRDAYGLYNERVNNIQARYGFLTNAEVSRALAAEFSIWYGYDENGDLWTRFNLDATFHYSELGVRTGGLNDNARALIQDLGRRAPAMLDLATYGMLADGAIIAAPYVADAALDFLANQAAKRIAAQLAKRTVSRELKNPHIFRPGNTHGLGPLLSRFGSQSALINQVASNVASQLPAAAGEFTMLMRVEGYNLVVTGTVNNGIPYISNFWIP